MAVMPKCDMHTDCFALSDGRCVCLSENDFGEKDCPFYKPGDESTREQIEADIKLYGLTHAGSGKE